MNEYATTATGSDYWVATYNGDASNTSVSSGLTAEPVTVSQATPTITTLVSADSVVVGSVISDSATVSGGYSPTGTVTFNLYDNANGTGTPLFTDANEPLSAGVASSASYTAMAAGTDYWVATYNGDADNVSVSSSSPASRRRWAGHADDRHAGLDRQRVVGSAIPDSATVSGGYSPTGTVTFNLYNNANGTGPPLFTDADEPLSGGVAISTGYTTIAPGSDYWVATYNGDANNTSVSSGLAAEPVTVGQARRRSSTTASAGSIVLGGSAIPTRRPSRAATARPAR